MVWKRSGETGSTNALHIVVNLLAHLVPGHSTRTVFILRANNFAVVRHFVDDKYSK